MLSSFSDLLARDIQTEYGRVDASVRAHASQSLRLTIILYWHQIQCFFSPPVQFCYIFLTCFDHNPDSSSSEPRKKVWILISTIYLQTVSVWKKREIERLTRNLVNEENQRSNKNAKQITVITKHTCCLCFKGCALHL